MKDSQRGGAFSPHSTAYADSYRRDGFAVAPRGLAAPLLLELRARIEAAILGAEHAGEAARRRGGKTFALRELLTLVPEIAQLARDADWKGIYVEPLLGPDTVLIRGILFDKTPGANWKVPWHQDIAVAVAAKPEDAAYCESQGWRAWSVKAGVPHAEPPEPYLSGRLALRLHLDPCGVANGPLRVLLGTHAKGRLNEGAIEAARRDVEAVECILDAGAVLAMHPLLLHASSAASSPDHRRVIHLEYAASLPLPDGLSWHAAPAH